MIAMRNAAPALVIFLLALCPPAFASETTPAHAGTWISLTPPLLAIFSPC
jgi:hypothetical protein